MLEKGYAAVTARSVAERAGLNYQLVFYYFQGMDDLLLTTYRRRTERVRERTAAALASHRPLHALWRGSSEPLDAALTLEYMALSNHNESIRAETIRFGEFIRRFVADELGQRFTAAAPKTAVFSPLAVSLALSHVGALLSFERALGISGGHDVTADLITWCLEQLEPDGEARGPG